ncbi:MAG: glycosyltransferase family 4 protein [Planctomycetota bacterium]
MPPLPPPMKSPKVIRRAGFISTRIAGTDGVSLEIDKWATVLGRMGIDCHYIGGDIDRPSDSSYLIEEASFSHPNIRRINEVVFGRRVRDLETTRAIHEAAWRLKQELYRCQKALKLDLLIAENVLTIPLNIPLGLALVELLIEMRLPAIAHHHDFFWERERFLVNAVPDYLRMAFPPAMSRLQHVVISSLAREQLSFRTGIAATVIPNVMDFAKPPHALARYAGDFRRAIGLSDEDWLILQPTRIVARKGIEHAVELVKRLEDPRAKLVISHSSGDEGDEYPTRVRNYARLLGVPIIYVGDIVGDERGVLPDGRKRYTVEDAYLNADIVTYPSTYEGFGNAFLEAVYYKRPIVCNRYSIYRTDIEPRGFDVIAMDGFVTDEVVGEARRVLMDRARRKAMVERNFKLGKRFFSFRVLENQLRALLTGFGGTDAENP